MFRVDLDVFRGPLDLLLYLVRKHEVPISEVPIAAVTEQYLDYLTLLESLDVNQVGDFLELASILIEIKSRTVLPQVEEVSEEIWDDPREELVQRLLEYKKYKDVASMLEERGRLWQQSYVRLANDLPPRNLSPAEQPIREVELWDLVSALGRIVKQSDRAPEANIVYDDTPIQTHMRTIYEGILAKGQMSMTEILRAGMHKSTVIGIFLAVLELVRHHSVEADQVEGEVEIWIRPGPEFQRTLNLADDVDSYDANPGDDQLAASA